jgi:hypothetical protein
MSNFIPGIELSRKYYWQVVRPTLDQHYPGLPHTAALLGPGSEVLGFDTEMSMDHHWFPNVQIFIQDEDEELAGPIHETLRWNLPTSFMDFPLNLMEIPGEPDTYRMQMKKEPPIDHYVYPRTLRSFIFQSTAWDIDKPLTAPDWLSIPSQILRSLTSGAVHHDGLGELNALRARLDWYPENVWLYMLAAGWHRIGDEEHLMPRAGYVGDELGSALIGSRLVRDIMSMCFFMEKQYAPFPKWFGTAFQQLSCAADLSPILWRTLMAETWQERMEALGEAYQFLAGMHNALGITYFLDEKVSNFHDRPFQVIHGEIFANAILEHIEDPLIQEIAQHTLIGSVDQISDNTKLRSDSELRSVLRQLYNV